MRYKKFSLYFIFILSLCASSQASVSFTLVPEVGTMGGYTEYEMDYRYEFYNYITGEPVFTVWRINSLLEFPLDTKIGGVALNMFSEKDPSSWNIKLKYLRSLSDPNEKMKDSDWEGFSTLFPYTKFSYTESDAESNMSLISAEAKLRIKKHEHYSMSLILSSRYQDINQDIIGYDGWYRPFDTVEVQYFDSTVAQTGAEDSLAMTYRLQVVQFELGLQSDIYFTDKITTQIKAALAPAFLNDTDDHVLREKISTSNSIGMGYTFGFNLQYDLPFKTISYIKFNSSFNTFRGDGSQMQLFYEHTSGLDPNTQFGSIPHVIRTKQYTISLQLGFEI